MYSKKETQNPRLRNHGLVVLTVVSFILSASTRNASQLAQSDAEFEERCVNYLSRPNISGWELRRFINEQHVSLLFNQYTSNICTSRHDSCITANKN